MLDALWATRQRVTFRAVDVIRMPEYKGATFRGALGHAFKKVACALPRKVCETCMLRQRCAYSVCFETPVPEDAAIMRRYPFAPHPFVLDPPQDGTHEYTPGEFFSIDLTLVGRGNEYLPQFIYAFEQLGEAGLGRDRGKAELVSLHALEHNGEDRVLYDHASQELYSAVAPIDAGAVAAQCRSYSGKPLRLTFETPVRLKIEGLYHRAVPEFSEMLPAVLRRIHSLNYFLCGGPSDVDVRPLLAAAAEVKILDAEIRWEDWSRYSGRQMTRMKLGGLKGWINYSPVPDVVLPYLLWGELLHIGKASAFGLGKYRLQSTS